MERKQTSVSDQWGTTPTLVEGIPAQISFRGVEAFEVAALDPAGNPIRTLPIVSTNGQQHITIGAENRTLWYLLTR